MPWLQFNSSGLVTGGLEDRLKFILGDSTRAGNRNERLNHYKSSSETEGIFRRNFAPTCAWQSYLDPLPLELWLPAGAATKVNARTFQIHHRSIGNTVVNRKISPFMSFIYPTL